ncbi:MAG TPA: hypothetical protein VLA99_09680 [Nitrospiraceae bacterium]|nr:hypothetical protein [Nitrospiraceae bacterium]
MKFTRKPGEPIYLRKHMVALVLALLATIVLPRLYEIVVGPLSFTGRFLSGLVIAVAAGIGLYFLFRSSAQNQP